MIRINPMLRSIPTALLLLLFPAAALAVRDGVHPSLVDPAKTKCETCHAEVLSGKIHPVMEAGCDNCHAFAKREGQWIVSLSAEGKDLCAQCHEEQGKRAALSKPHMPVDDCSNCHVPHASEQVPLLSASLPDLCLGCHDKDETKAKHKGQPVHATNCGQCHDPHGNDKPKFLTGKVMHPPFNEGACESCHRPTRSQQVRFISKVPALCYACHTDLEKKFKGTSVHGPVAKGECTQCHDPHMAGQAKLVKERSPQLCFGCHPAIEQALKANAHAPAKDDCGVCHGTHATGRPHLLLDAMMGGPGIQSLCANCHAADPKWKAKHLGADPSKLDCTGCHDPHGSTQKHLLNMASIHPPFTEGCGTCHSEGTGLAEKDPDLCFMCHDGIKEAASKAKAPHPALDMGCTSCHTPHVSAEPHLIKGPQVQVCGECHSMEHPFMHGVIASVGCQACHEPHGGSGPKLLKQAGNKLCLDCHGVNVKPGPAGTEPPRQGRPIALSQDLTRGHPVVQHPVAGKPAFRRKVWMPKGMEEMSCLSCHNPHGGKNPKLFAFDQEDQYALCAVCHQNK
jgi:predicted CXXCH cytochrome family protein